MTEKFKLLMPDSLEDKQIHCCADCGCEIDPDWCHCGSAIEDHNGWGNHSPVPMGCQCYRDIPDWVKS